MNLRKALRTIIDHGCSNQQNASSIKIPNTRREGCIVSSSISVPNTRREGCIVAAEWCPTPACTCTYCKCNLQRVNIKSDKCTQTGSTMVVQCCFTNCLITLYHVPSSSKVNVSFQRCQFMKMVGGRDWQISPTYLPLFFLLGFRPLYFEVQRKKYLKNKIKYTLAGKASAQTN